MKKLIINLTLLSSLLSGCSLLSAPKAGLHVESNIPATVLIDDKQVGQVPYASDTLRAQKYTVTVKPIDPSYPPYQGQLRLYPGQQTSIVWNFAKTTEQSWGWVFSQTDAKDTASTELELTTSPPNVPVTIAGLSKGFTPLTLGSLSTGSINITLQAPGFADLAREVTFTNGKRLVIFAKLASLLSVNQETQSQGIPQLAVPGESATPSGLVVQTLKKPYILIQDTPTGFLRVRAKPDAGGTELGQLAPGSSLSYLSKEVDGWYQVQFQATSSAWVNAQYAKLVQ
ncbi:MAG TPA: PEGA domain-containing protein [Patescibacteria group bacterium]|nr:PEGA domain-containing protein [Patescibacteria group bacterium]